MKERLQYSRQLSGFLTLYQVRAGRRRVHRHDELECNLIRCGAGRYLVDGRRLDLQPGSVLWLFPGQEHQLLDHSADFGMWILVIRPSVLRQICTDETTAPLRIHQPQTVYYRFLTGDWDMRLERLCCELMEMEGRIPVYNAGLSYLLLSSWEAYLQGSDAPVRRALHPAIARVLPFLRGAGRDSGLHELAEFAGLAPATLSRLFAREVGVTITDYRNNQRLERFFDGYNPDQSLLALAYQAGFGSYAQFYRVFKEKTGRTPAQFQRAYRRRERRSTPPGA